MKASAIQCTGEIERTFHLFRRVEKRKKKVKEEQQQQQQHLASIIRDSRTHAMAPRETTGGARNSDNNSAEK